MFKCHDTLAREPLNNKETWQKIVSLVNVSVLCCLVKKKIPKEWRHSVISVLGLL